MGTGLAGIRFTHQPTVEGLNALFTRIDEARGERNSLVHGVWGPSSEKGAATVQTIKLDRNEIIRTELVTVRDLDELFKEITSIADELHAVGVKLGFIRKH